MQLYIELVIYKGAALRISISLSDLISAMINCVNNNFSMSPNYFDQ